MAETESGSPPTAVERSLDGEMPNEGVPLRRMPGHR